MTCIVRFFVLSVATTALLLVSRPAQAELVEFLGVGRHVSNLSITVGSLTQSVAAGELNWSWVDGAPAGFGPDFVTYCIDAVNSLRNPQNVVVRSTNALAGNSGEKVAWLLSTYGATVSSNVQAAALQIAIWEALYDSHGSLSGGTFRLNTAGAVATQAGIYLTSLYAADFSTAHATWLDTSRGQDQVTYGVPEPATLALMAFGALGFARRWRSARR